jgi:2-iminobutanoate/2-iminopropanoate deaminase
MSNPARVSVIAAAVLTPALLFAAAASREYVLLDHSSARARLPFSDGVVVGNTLYVAGTIGSDPKTGQAPADPAEEARLVMDSVKRTVEGAGFKMDDLVSVQVFCTDLALYDTFNNVYRSYFHEHFPARALVGAAKLLRNGHYEVMGIAVKGSSGAP